MTRVPFPARRGAPRATSIGHGEPKSAARARLASERRSHGAPPRTAAPDRLGVILQKPTVARRHRSRSGSAPIRLSSSVAASHRRPSHCSSICVTVALALGFLVRSASCSASAATRVTSRTSSPLRRVRRNSFRMASQSPAVNASHLRMWLRAQNGSDASHPYPQARHERRMARARLHPDDELATIGSRG